MPNVVINIHGKLVVCDPRRLNFSYGSTPVGVTYQEVEPSSVRKPKLSQKMNYLPDPCPSRVSLYELFSSAFYWHDIIFGANETKLQEKMFGK